MITSELTRREKDTLEAITLFLDANKYPPSIKEIAAMIDVSSTSTVTRFLVGLEHKGYIERVGSKSRSMRVLQHAS
ncbi:MarR family transcriptional regulator [Paenibacillus polymyxa]|uniref:LexA family protein n=1 Tax=Paenibacillus polymyxa TaxID=1406 RepID=UPI0032AEFB1F